MKKHTKIWLLWLIAVILAIINVVLFMAAMGYDTLDFSLYNSLKNLKNINTLFYILSTIDIMLFCVIVTIYRISKRLTGLAISVLACLTQIILLMLKVKI